MFFLAFQAPNFLTPFGWNMDPSANGQQFLAQVQDQILQKDISKPNRKKKKFDTDPIGLEGMDKGKNPKGGNKKFSRVRTSFSQDQQQELETYFTDCMYPNASEIQKLSKKLGLNETTVQVRTACVSNVCTCVRTCTNDSVRMCTSECMYVCVQVIVYVCVQVSVCTYMYK